MSICCGMWHKYTHIAILNVCVAVVVVEDDDDEDEDGDYAEAISDGGDGGECPDVYNKCPDVYQKISNRM